MYQCKICSERVESQFAHKFRAVEECSAIHICELCLNYDIEIVDSDDDEADELRIKYNNQIYNYVG